MAAFSLPCHFSLRHSFLISSSFLSPFCPSSLKYLLFSNRKMPPFQPKSVFACVEKTQFDRCVLDALEADCAIEQFDKLICIQTMSLPARLTCCVYKEVKQIGHQRQKLKPLMIKGSITLLEDTIKKVQQDL